jgi:hypothetical protein
MRTRLNFSTPYWWVTLGSTLVGGNAPMLGMPVTLTLRSGDGAFSQVITDTDLSHNSDFLVDFARPIHPGDRLTMETAGEVNAFTVPYLSAVFDYARRVLEGSAPSGGELSAWIPTGHTNVTRRIRLLPDGSFGVDTSDLNPLVGDWGYIYYTDRFGNTVECPFMIRGYPLYLPVLRWATAFP